MAAARVSPYAVDDEEDDAVGAAAEGSEERELRREAIIQSAVFTRQRSFRHQSTLTFLQKLIYSAPQYSLTSLTMLIGIHGNVFYLQLGAHLAFLAFFIAIARSFDVITDPVMGWVSDRTRHKMGRRRPWMLGCCWGYSLAFFLLMSPPSGLKDGKSLAVWFGFFYVTFYAFDTLCNVPYSALGPELSDDSAERTSLFFWSKLFNGVGILCAATLPVFFQMAFSCEDCDAADSRKAFRLTSLVFGVYFITTVVGAVVALRERPLSQCINNPTPPFVPAILSTLRNKPFVLLLPAWVLDVMAITMLGTMLPFFVEYVVVPASVPECLPEPQCEDESTSLLYPGCRAGLMCTTSPWIGVGLVFLMGASIIAMPVWLFLTRRFKKRTTWLAFNLVTAVTDGLFVFVGSGDPILCCLFAFFNGIPAGGQFLTDSVLADVIDYDEFLTGSRSEGQFTIFQTLLPKLMSIPSQTIPLTLLAFMGFRQPIQNVPQPQPASVVVFIKLVFFVLPTLLALTSFVIKLRFPLRTDEQVRKIQEGCALHMQGMAAEDPLTGRSVTVRKYVGEEQEKVWALDSFFLSQLDLLRKYGIDEGGRRIQRQIRRGVYIAAGLGTFFLASMGLALALGALDEPRAAWIPSFSVILGGMQCSYVAFNYQRLKTAGTLPALGITGPLVEEVYRQRRGIDEPAINTKSPAVRIPPLSAFPTVVSQELPANWRTDTPQDQSQAGRDSIQED